PNARALVRGSRDDTETGSDAMRAMGFAVEDSKSEALARKARDPVALAAIALLAAARHEDDPFANPIVQALSAKAAHHPAIPLVAIHFWMEVIDGGNTFDKSVRFRGMGRIWEVIGSSAQLDAHIVGDVAGSAAFHQELREMVRPVLLRFAARDDLSADEKAGLASQLARYYGLVDEPERLMSSGGKDAPGYSIVGIRASIAMARLRSGYDAQSARLVIADVLADTSAPSVFTDFDNESHLGALEKGSAKNELRQLAAAYLNAAAAAGDRAGPWYAGASDCYLRAGDREKAIETAGAGLKYVPAAVRTAVTVKSADSSPQALAKQAQGRGTEPVVALYRAGAIREALEFGYLSGKDRYLNAARAGEPADPQWVLDDEWPLYIEVMVFDAVLANDKAQQQRIFEAMMKPCTSLDSKSCTDETRQRLAHLAGALGKRTAVRELLSAEARQLDTQPRGDAAFWAVSLAAQWAHALELLDAAATTQ
ncbi:MAG TPA: hypothetical protein VKB34_03320, partial [Povalibacter sp.]|nr:hypothetical protein [Povalibacter sp.]